MIEIRAEYNAERCRTDIESVVDNTNGCVLPEAAEAITALLRTLDKASANGKAGKMVLQAIEALYSPPL